MAKHLAELQGEIDIDGFQLCNLLTENPEDAGAFFDCLSQTPEDEMFHMAGQVRKFFGGKADDIEVIVAWLLCFVSALEGDK